jgi:hypothetical protein
MDKNKCPKTKTTFPKCQKCVFCKKAKKVKKVILGEDALKNEKWNFHL